jgi:hypothetical protein
MSLFDPADDERMFQAINGQNARRGAGWVVIQDAGTTNDGRPIYAVVGVAVGELRHEEGKGRTHEMVHGEVIIRPRAAYAGDKYKGAGAAGILTGNAYDPENWDQQIPLI